MKIKAQQHMDFSGIKNVCHLQVIRRGKVVADVKKKNAITNRYPWYFGAMTTTTQGFDQNNYTYRTLRPLFLGNNITIAPGKITLSDYTSGSYFQGNTQNVFTRGFYDKNVWSFVYEFSQIADNDFIIQSVVLGRNTGTDVLGGFNLPAPINILTDDTVIVNYTCNFPATLANEVIDCGNMAITTKMIDIDGGESDGPVIDVACQRVICYANNPGPGTDITYMGPAAKTGVNSRPRIYNAGGTGRDSLNTGNFSSEYISPLTELMPVLKYTRSDTFPVADDGNDYTFTTLKYMVGTADRGTILRFDPGIFVPYTDTLKIDFEFTLSFSV